MTDLTTLLLAAALIILSFLFGREVICWYFKINQIIDLMLEISEKLEPRQPPVDRLPD